MRPEQITRLSEIEEALTDIFIAESQVKKWPGMKTAAERGDRYWHKKNALATLTLVGRIQTVLRDIRTGDGGEKKPGADTPPEEPESLEAEAARLEKQGVALLRKHGKKRA